MSNLPLFGDLAASILEATSEGIIIADTSTRAFIYANTAACGMFGYARQELTSRGLADVHPPADLPTVLSAFEGLLARTLPVARAVPCLRKDGGTFRADIRAISAVVGGASCLVGFFTDVTDRVRSDEISSKVFDTSPSAIGISRLADGVFLDINPGFTDLTGYAREDIVGRTVLPGDLGIWVRKEDRDRLVRLLKENKGTARIDARFRRKDGYVIYGVMHARVMDLNGVACLLTITNDISDTKIAELALSEEKERLAVTLQSIGDAVITTDTDGKVALMNRVAEELTGWRQEEAAGRPLPEIFHIVNDVTHDPCEDPAALVLATDAIVDLADHTALIARDGTRRMVADSAAPIKDAGGTILGVVLVFRDMTERRMAEMLLRLSEEKFRTLIEQNTDGVALADELGTVMEWNPAFESITGIPRRDVIGKPIWDAFGLLRPSSGADPRIVEVVRQHFAGGLTQSDSPLFGRNREVSFMRGEEELTVVQTIFPIKTEHGYRAGCIIRDITEQKKSSLALQKADKLESLGVLAGGIAHDFNNLLGVIYGNIELASDTTREPEVAEYLKSSMDTMNRVRALTQQLLTFARGGAPVKRVEPLFPFTETAVSFALSGSSTTCRFDVEPALWNCSFDKNQIGQVIDNIVINAVQAMPQGGLLRVSAANLVVGDNDYPSLSRGRYVRVSFADQGPGIPKELLSRIFDPFFTTKTTGNGLGLATCYSIIRQHAGWIAVESEPGKGSTFHVLLPASEAPASGESGSEEKSFRGSGTILVMDDDSGIRVTAGRILERMGYSCRTAGDGHGALEEYTRIKEEGGRCRAIICDLTVRGGMSGKVFLKEIRRIDAAIPVIVSSGYADNPILADPRKHGFSDSLRKPYTAAELGEVLARNVGE